jgi:cardiolipin synthase
MRVSRLIILFCSSLALVILIGAVQLIFNPLGLGPEPEAVLSRHFFATPTQDLSELELLVDGREAFRKIVDAIDSVKSSIYVQTYIWKDDDTGNMIVAKLKAAANRGVQVTVHKDLLGTFFELADMLKGKPSPVFTKTGLKGYPNINVHVKVVADTDHSKYFIVGNRVAIFGGMNIADEYHYKWHDYMVLIQSRRWAKVFANKVIKGSPWPNPSPFVVTVNDRKATEIRTALIQVIDNARENLIIEHAYFSDDKVIAAVKRAAARNVKVDIILPKTPDTHLYANMATINRLLEPGHKKVPKIFLYPHMSHAKVALADGVIAAVGSANLTPRSMVTSREVTLFVHGESDAVFFKKLRDQLEIDVAKSEQVLEPFKLSFADNVKAVLGKYVW